MKTTLALLILALVIFSGPIVKAETDELCEAQGHQLIAEPMLDPKGLDSYIRANQLKTVDDVICCLPKSYRQNFAIVHSSDSAQSSDVKRPRVLLFGPKRDAAANAPIPFLPPQAIVSFNGGGSDLNKSEIIEMLYNNMSSGEAELYDFDLSGRELTRSYKNPQECLQCHGNQGVLSLGGPKPIFEPSDNWTRFVQGVHVCGDVEEKLARQIEASSQKSFKKNRRYRCLDQQVARTDHFSGHSTTTARELQDLDFYLTELNDRRVARWIRSTANYNEFKYAVVGTLLCASVRNDQDGTPLAENATLKNWIPDRVLYRMTDTTAISSEIRNAQQPLVAAESLLNETNLYRAQLSVQQELLIKKLAAGGNGQAEFYRGPLGCNETPASTLDRLKQTLTGDPTLDLYKIDTYLRSLRARPSNPFFRYLFEARGISLADVSEEPTPGKYLSQSRILAQALIDLEPKGTVFYKIGQKIKAASLSVSLFPGQSDLNRVFNATEKDRA